MGWLGSSGVGVVWMSSSGIVLVVFSSGGIISESELWSGDVWTVVWLWSERPWTVGVWMVSTLSGELKGVGVRGGESFGVV